MSQYPLCDCARANEIAVEVICVTFGNMETVFSFHFMLLSDDGAEAESTIVDHEGEAKVGEQQHSTESPDHIPWGP